MNLELANWQRIKFYFIFVVFIAGGLEKEITITLSILGVQRY